MDPKDLIYSSGRLIVNLQEICHLEKRTLGWIIVTTKTVYSSDLEDYENAAWLPDTDMEAFMAVWLNYLLNKKEYAILYGEDHQILAMEQTDKVQYEITPEWINKLLAGPDKQS